MLSYGGGLWLARARLPDLTDCDLFSWGNLKTNIFQVDPPRTIEAFKQQIVGEIRTIPFNMLQQLMLNIQSTLEECTNFNRVQDIGSVQKKIFSLPNF